MQQSTIKNAINKRYITLFNIITRSVNLLTKIDTNIDH